MFVVGVGSSSHDAARVIDAAIDAIDAIDGVAVCGTSDSYANPGFGTPAQFTNAAVVVDTRLSARALLQALHSVEHRFGRVRANKNAPRTLDLDVLLALPFYPPTSAPPTLPHPRLAQRRFAVEPARQALARAGVVPPISLQLARAYMPVSPLQRVATSLEENA